MLFSQDSRRIEWAVGLICLPVHLVAATDPHHQDTQHIVLNIANHAAIPYPIPPQLTQWAGQCLAPTPWVLHPRNPLVHVIDNASSHLLVELTKLVRADAVYSIAQVKGISHVVSGVHVLFALPKTLQYVRGKVVVLHILKATLDHLAQVESLGASVCEDRKSSRCSVSGASRIEVAMSPVLQKSSSPLNTRIHNITIALAASSASLPRPGVGCDAWGAGAGGVRRRASSARRCAGARIR